MALTITVVPVSPWGPVDITVDTLNDPLVKRIRVLDNQAVVGAEIIQDVYANSAFVNDHAVPGGGRWTYTAESWVQSRHNYFTNPSFEGGLSAPWIATGMTASVNLSPLASPIPEAGTHWLRGIATSGSVVTGVHSQNIATSIGPPGVSLVEGDTWTASGYMRGPLGLSGSVVFRWFDAAGVPLVDTPIQYGTEEDLNSQTWTRMGLQVTVPPLAASFTVQFGKADEEKFGYRTNLVRSPVGGAGVPVGWENRANAVLTASTSYLSWKPTAAAADKPRIQVALASAASAGPGQIFRVSGELMPVGKTLTGYVSLITDTNEFQSEVWETLPKDVWTRVERTVTVPAGSAATKIQVLASMRDANASNAGLVTTDTMRLRKVILEKVVFPTPERVNLSKNPMPWRTNSWDAGSLWTRASAATADLTSPSERFLRFTVKTPTTAAPASDVVSHHALGSVLGTIPALQDVSYIASMYVRSSVIRKFSMRMTFLDAVNGVISTTDSPEIQASANTWQRFAVQEFAPAGASSLVITLRHAIGDLKVNEYVDVAAMLVEPLETLDDYFSGESDYSWWSGVWRESASGQSDNWLLNHPFFDGNSVTVPGWTHAWTGTVNNSTSVSAAIYEFDALLLEKNIPVEDDDEDILGEYFDGSSHDGAGTWVGAPNASESDLLGLYETAIAFVDIVVTTAPVVLAVDQESTCVTLQVRGSTFAAGPYPESLRVYRIEQDGSAIPVRGGYVAKVDPAATYTVIDCEAPLDEPFGYCNVYWVPEVNVTYEQLLSAMNALGPTDPLGQNGYRWMSITYISYTDVFYTEEKPPVEPMTACTDLFTIIPGCPVWLKSPVDPELNVPLCCVTRMPERSYPHNAAWARQLTQRKNVSVWDLRSEWEGELEFIAMTAEQDEAILKIIEEGGPLLFQSVQSWDHYHDWVQPADISRAQAIPTYIQRPERRWVFSLVSVLTPAMPKTSLLPD